MPENPSFYFLLGAGYAAAFMGAWRLGVYGISKYTEKQKLRKDFRDKFGFEAPGFYKMREIRERLEKGF